MLVTNTLSFLCLAMLIPVAIWRAPAIDVAGSMSVNRDDEGKETTHCIQEGVR